MPLISSKGMYGLDAMIQLLEYKKEYPMQIREIASRSNIPQNYLEQLLRKLKKAHLVVSVRGSRGGYLLARDPQDILIKDILIALEDDIKVIDTKSNSFILNLFFEETKSRISEIFHLSLFDLQVQYQKKYNEYLHYNI